MVNNSVLYIIAILYPVLNLLLYQDLYWIMINPFYPQRKRNNVYCFGIFMLIFLVLCEEITLLFQPMNSKYYTMYSYPLISLIINTICFLWSFILIILIIKRLLRKGTSPKLRKIITIRYLTLYVVFLGQYVKLISVSISQLNYDK